ncbi:MAG: TRAP transporter large permease subunit, partial [Alphaproteobacteria bacterium]
MSEILAVLLFGATLAALLAGFPVAFTLAGSALIFALLGHVAGVFELSLLGTFAPQIFGRMTNGLLVAVPLFVFMGVMLERSRVAEELLETMGRAFGTLRGGLGISVILVGALLAASTGIVGATVVTMGLLSLPTMLKHGYDPKLAAGTICAAGTLGQIIPPSIVLVLLGEVMSSSYQQVQLAKGNFAPDSISVGDLFAGAMLPGLLLVALYLIYLLGVAQLRPLAAPALPARELGDGRPGVRQLASGLAPPVMLFV